MSVWCVLLAAGRGSRSGLEMNKVFFRWQGGRHHAIQKEGTPVRDGQIV